MKMRYYLLSTTIYGVKNISEPVELKFYDKTIPNEFTNNNSNIKSIYGENGSGKTALIHAFNIYKNLVGNPNYLYDTSTQKYLDAIINKIENKFFIEVEFLYTVDKKAINKYQHLIEVKKTNDEYIISREKINIANDRAKYKLFYNYENGKFNSESFDEELLELTYNQLDKKSISNIFFQLIINKINNKEENWFDIIGMKDFISLMSFSSQFYFFMKEQDNHDLFFNHGKKVIFI